VAKLGHLPLRKTSFSGNNIKLGDFSLKSTYFSGSQTFLGDFPLIKHLFLKNSDIFRGFSFNKALIAPKFGQ
jgi:hypothetical protein